MSRIFISQNKRDCSGCMACAQVCPSHCISRQKDEEGFSYPVIDFERCASCGLCKKICPVINVSLDKKPIAVYASTNPDEATRVASTSGGIFTVLAERIINKGGIVFGARFNNNWEIVHDYTDTISGLSVFRGSKYVQSRVGNAYCDVRRLLNDGRAVLFSGTPCQIAGLKLFLGKDYDNLLSVECVCHGVPSPELWFRYLKEQTNKDGYDMTDIKHINFRDKSTGWRNYSFLIEYYDGKYHSVVHDNNPWIRAFIHNFSLRPSCYNCKFKFNNSRADITLGDLWGADQLLQKRDDDKGESLILCHSEKGLSAIHSLSLGVIDLSLSEVIKYNPALASSAKEPESNEEFKNRINKYGYINTVKKMTKDSLSLRVKLAIVKMLNKK